MKPTQPPRSAPIDLDLTPTQPDRPSRLATSDSNSVVDPGTRRGTKPMTPAVSQPTARPDGLAGPGRTEKPKRLYRCSACADCRTGFCWILPPRWTILLFVWAVSWVVRATGLDPGSLDPSFHPAPGLNGHVMTLALQADGKVVVGGKFTTVDNTPRGGIARLNTDGSVDLTFDPGGSAGSDYTPLVHSLAVQADGKVLVGGEFTRMNGTPRFGVARLHADGSLDKTFVAHPQGTWEAAYVYALALQSDGRILVANWKWVYRLNPDGSLDNTFHPAFLNWHANTMVLQPDLRILLGGDFKTVNGVSRNKVARLNVDGTLDPTFDPGPGPAGDVSWMSAWISALAVQQDGKVLVGGLFTKFAGMDRHNLARLHSDGRLDSGFIPHTSREGYDYYSRSVDALAVQSDGTIVAGGQFQATNAIGTAFKRLARFNPQGGVDATFRPEISGGGLRCVTVLGNGKILLAGLFDLVNGTVRHSVARLTGGMGPVLTDQPQNLVVLSGATASFSVEAGGSPPLSYVWHKDGEPVSDPQDRSVLTIEDAQPADSGTYTVVVSNAFGAVLSAAATLEVTGLGQAPYLLDQPQSRSVVEGGNAALQVAAGGTAPLVFQWQKQGVNISGATNPVLSWVGVQPTDAGQYSVRVSNGYGSIATSAADLTVLSPPIFTAPDSPMRVMAGETVTISVALRGTPPLYCQWQFNGSAIPGATQPTLILGNVQRTASGSYTLMASNEVGVALSPSILLAVWQAGAVDPTFQATLDRFNNFGVNVVVPQPDGKVLVGARPLRQLWGGPRPPSFGLRRLRTDGSLDPTFTPNLGPGGGVRAIALMPEGNMLIGGWFLGVNGVPRNGLARLHPDGTLDTTFAPVPSHYYRILLEEDKVLIDGLFDVWTLGLQPDGKVLVGGEFKSALAWQRQGLVRFNPDGSVDPTFRPVLTLEAEENARVRALAIQSDGKIIAAGYLPSLPNPYGPVRLNPDGTLDASFHPGSGPGQDFGSLEQPGIHALALQPDGTILMAGDFTSYDGEPRQGIVRLHQDGGLDPVFQAPNAPARVAALALQPDGKVILGGAFAAPLPGLGDGILRLQANGALDPDFHPGQGVNGGQVDSIALQNDGHLLVGGVFFTFDDTDCNSLVRVFGSVAPTLLAALENQEVRLNTPASFRVVATGSPPLAYQWHREGVALPGQTNASFALASAQLSDAGNYTVVVGNPFGQLTSPAALLTVRTVSGLSIGYRGSNVTSVVGGHVTFSANVGGTLPYGIQWKRNDIPIPGATNAICSLRNVQLSDAGAYTCTVTNLMNHLTGQSYNLTVAQPPKVIATSPTQLIPFGASARLQVEATGDPPLEYQWWIEDEAIADANQSSLEVPPAFSPQSRTYTVQVSNAVGFVLSPPVRVVEGQTGQPDPSFTNIPLGWLDRMDRATDGHILVGHDIMSVAGVGYDHIARLTPDGLPDLTFETWGVLAGYCDTCSATLFGVQPDGKVLAGGEDDALLRLHPDGFQDGGFWPPLELLGIIRSCATQPDGKILVVSMKQEITLRRLGSDGSLDPAFVTARIMTEPGDEYSCAVQITPQPDGKILVWGDFIGIQGVGSSYLARLQSDGTPDLDFQVGTGPNRSVDALVVQSDGRILMGGAFTSFDGTPCSGLVRLQADGTLDPSLDPRLEEPYTDYVINHLYVQGIGLQPDGRIFLGGTAELYSPQNGEWTDLGGVVRLLPDGRLDVSFPPYAFGDIAQLDLLPDGRVLLAGNQSGLVQLLGDLPPAITASPQIGGPVVAGDTLVLSVVVTGGLPCAYQWQKDGVNLLGQTNATLTLNDVEPADAGDYRVIVSNLAGSTTSDTARLIVVPAPAGPGSLDLTFDPTADGQWVGVAGTVTEIRSILRQPDGTLLIGGSFCGVNGVPRHNVARLHSDGRVDPGFVPWPGIDREVWSVARQTDGKVLVAGAFTGVNGRSRFGVGRLHPDGTLDTAFQPQVDGILVAAVAVQADGKILIGGGFTNVNGTPRSNLARLHPNGSLDAAFSPPALSHLYYPYIHFIAPQPDGRIYVGGEFDGSLLRLNADGTPDDSFIPNYSPSHLGGGVRALAIQPDGRLLIGGGFTSVGGHTRHYLARLHPDGGLDTSFDPSQGQTVGFNSWIKAIAIRPDGRIIVGGSFFRIGNTGCHGLARLQSNGLLDACLDPGIPSTCSWCFPSFNALLEQPDGSLIVGAASDAPNALLALNNDGIRQSHFAPVIDGGKSRVGQLALQPDGKVLIGGNFASINGSPRGVLARLNHDGTLDPSFAFAFAPEEQFFLCALTTQPDGKVLIGGWWNFTPAGFPQGIARLHPDGRVDAGFNAGTGTSSDAAVYAISLQSDERILIGGEFNYVNGSEHPGIARLHPDGSVDESFQTPPGIFAGDGDGVFSVAVQTNGRILIAGRYNYSGAIANLARLLPNGDLDTSFNPQGWLEEGGFDSVAVQPDGRILVSGGFRRLGGDAQFYNLARLQPDGSLDPDFPPQSLPTGANKPTLQRDGKILVLGEGGVVRLHPDGSPDPVFQNNLNGRPFTIALQSDGRVLIGGEFTGVQGIPRPGIARLLNDLAIPGPFGHRHIVSSTVDLAITPPPETSAYAVEDQVLPMGAVVTQISHHGVFDAATSKVKFGPFYDAEPRTLSYQVVTPPNCVHGLCAVYTFAGTVSVDGLNIPIVGDRQMIVAGLHPADWTPADSHLAIGEVTAYGAAWRRGQAWPVPPLPIPIDYVTRAGALWRGGECYTVDASIITEPLWWVSCPPSHGASGYSAGCGSSPGAAGAVTRHIPPHYVPGCPVAVTLSALPETSVCAYAVEDRIPHGWALSLIGQGGEFDPINRLVKWGPFLDNAPRTFRYEVAPPPTAGGPAGFEGQSSWDGLSTTMRGPNELQETCRFTVQMPAAGPFAAVIQGRVGARFMIEASTDLIHWTPVDILTNRLGTVEFMNTDQAVYPQRFYRAQLLDPTEAPAPISPP